MRLKFLSHACLCLWLLGLLAACQESVDSPEQAPPPAAQDLTLLENLRIFDVHNGTLSEPQDLLLKGERIAGLGGIQVQPLPASQRIDCTGKVALPGLFDCHTHLSHLAMPGEEQVEEGLAALAQAGITAVRDVGGPVDLLSDMSKRVASKEICGPELFFTGPMLEQSPLTWGDVNEELPGFTVAVDNREDLESLFQDLSWKGACMIKTFSKIEPELYQKLVNLARLHDLRIVHDPGKPLFHWMPMDKALDLGVTSIEHAKAPWPVVLKEELQAEHDKLIGAEVNPMLQQMFMMKVSQLGTESICPEKLNRLAAKMKEKKAYLCPTMDVFSSMYEMSIAQIKEEMQLDEVPERAKKMIRQGTDSMQAICRLFVRTFAEQGVRLLVGQDGLKPEGTFSEMRLLKECGVSEAEILRGATLYPAQWLGVDDRLGSLEVGKTANILVIDADPLEEISRVEETFLVVKEGEVIFTRS